MELRILKFYPNCHAIFLYEDGFLCATDSGGGYLTLTIPNKAAHRLIHAEVRLADLTRKCEDPFFRSTLKFAKSLENVAESCKEDSVRALADSTRCDGLLVIEDHKVAFIFDCKSINKKSNYAHRQIIDKRYYTQLQVFSSLTKKILMESPIAKRPKMSEHEINEPTQKSSDTK
ncbi:hypothetical protein PV325_011166, partial [Microctonus aethiopoides]